MGPRSCERKSPMLEKESKEAYEASMGPRSCERGSCDSVRGGRIQHDASMGPRSCERGSLLAANQGGTLWISFNGAAFV